MTNISEKPFKVMSWLEGVRATHREQTKGMTPKEEAAFWSARVQSGSMAEFWNRARDPDSFREEDLASAEVRDIYTAMPWLEQVRAEIREETSGLSHEEESAYYRRHVAEGPFADLWERACEGSAAETAPLRPS